jgi:DHA1 family bicyclomycin/chloramphenicol resistance-like MFS transporter
MSMTVQLFHWNSAGQLLYGPLLDRYGRKPLFIGLFYSILALGCVLYKILILYCLLYSGHRSHATVASVSMVQICFLYAIF